MMVFAAFAVACGSSDTTSSATPGDSGAGGAGGAARPRGTVTTCFGDACPLGKCDYPSDCAAIYTAPLDDGSSLCGPGATGAYCMDVIAPLVKWGVQCTAGSAVAHSCANMCGISSTGTLTCN